MLTGENAMPEIPDSFWTVGHATAPTELAGTSFLEVKAGQVWRARWSDVSLLVLVLGAEEEENHKMWVPVIPITIEPHAENQGSLVLSSELNMFDVEVTLWCALESKIPFQTLDVCFGEVSEEVVAASQAVSRGEADALPRGSRLGKLFPSIFSQDAEYQALIEDDLAELAEARGLSVLEESTRIKVRSQLRLIGLSRMMDELGVTQPIAMQILRAKGKLTAEQVSRIAQLTNLDLDDLERVFQGVPAAVVKVVEHPRWRSGFERLSIGINASVGTLRDQSAHEIYALAARESRPSVSFEDRLTRWFEDRSRTVGSDQQ